MYIAFATLLLAYKLSETVTVIQWCTDMRFYWLSDIEIHTITDTDNWSDVYIYQNSTCILQNFHFKNTILVLIYKNNVIKVCKINCTINQPAINDTDTAKM